jgi:hypothetical protein
LVLISVLVRGNRTILENEGPQVQSSWHTADSWFRDFTLIIRQKEKENLLELAEYIMLVNMQMLSMFKGKLKITPLKPCILDPNMGPYNLLLQTQNESIKPCISDPKMSYIPARY